jgi:hypothetical protein
MVGLDRFWCCLHAAWRSDTPSQKNARVRVVTRVLCACRCFESDLNVCRDANIDIACRVEVKGGLIARCCDPGVHG